MGNPLLGTGLPPAVFPSSASCFELSLHFSEPPFLQLCSRFLKHCLQEESVGGGGGEALGNMSVTSPSLSQGPDLEGCGRSLGRGGLFQPCSFLSSFPGPLPATHPAPLNSSVCVNN